LSILITSKTQNRQPGGFSHAGVAISGHPGNHAGDLRYVNNPSVFPVIVLFLDFIPGNVLV